MLEKNKPSPWLFLIGTIIWTWTFLIVTFFTGQSYLQFSTVLLSLTGGLGPLFISLILIILGYWDKELDKTPFQFIRRVLNPLTLKFNWKSSFCSGVISCIRKFKWRIICGCFCHQFGSRICASFVINNLFLEMDEKESLFIVQELCIKN